MLLPLVYCRKRLNSLFPTKGNVRGNFLNFAKFRKFPLPSRRVRRKAAHLRDKRDFFRRTCRRKKHIWGFVYTPKGPLLLPLVYAGKRQKQGNMPVVYRFLKK